MSKSSVLSQLAFVAIAVLPAAAFAQDRSALLLRVPTEETMTSTGRSQPGVTASSPLGFGPSWGDVFAGAGFQANTRYGGKEDGSVSVGAGLGNSTGMLGVELVLTSLSTVRTGFGQRMVGAIKVHKILLYDIAVGVGVEGFKIVGENFEIKESYYVAVSKHVPLFRSDYFSSVMLNIGAGNGRFQREDDVLANKNDWNTFASTGLRVAPALVAIADWTGQDLNLALSIAPLAKYNLVITPGVADVTGSAGSTNGYDGKPRFTLGGGFSWHF